LEHRCSVRIPLALDVAIVCRTLGLVRGRTHNVSVGGMLVDIGRIQLPVNSLVDTSLMLREEGEDRPYHSPAVVIHSGEPGVGLMFSDMAPELFDRLHQLIFPSLGATADTDP
jgi:c-di-GMP-binding flagellar brake protein YcgR